MQYNGVQIDNTPNYIIITDSDANQVVVTQPLTNVVEVSTPGPKGTIGATGPSGSLQASNSGSFQITGSLLVSAGITGSLLGTASTASYYNTAGLAITGSNTFVGTQTVTGSLIITGSVQGNVSALSITSNTASMDLSAASFFTLQLVSGSNTYINPTNIRPGTTTILISTTGSATVTFPSIVKQPSGSAYTPTTSTGKDVLTFLSYDTTTLYVANVKNLI